ncbi:hypothetical protein JW710_00820 [Candidatus Dojkabacteria bacterium]|nr:hypothetical protein [Candidatus Dojkabacteria bacterium]
MISKKKNVTKLIDITKKILLGSVLFILLWSRVLSSYSSIQQAHASFSTDIGRGKINTPYTENQEQISVAHLNKQADLAKNHGIELKQIADREAKAQRVRNFYARWNSPMAANAYYIVEVSDLFGLDYRLLPAISIVESSGGIHCFRSYNPFGWGQRGFNSFNEAIYTVGYGLRYGYGTSNPYAIAPTYNPVTPDAWGAKVNALMNQI